MRIINLAVVMALACSLVAAQQTEPNGPNGSLTVNGSGPTGVGNPIAIRADQTVDIDVGGLPNSPFTLFIGSLAPVSIPLPDGQFFDLNLAPLATIVDGIGINLTPAGLPSTFGALNPNGDGTIAFGLNNAAVGASAALQAAVTDPAALLGFDLSGAPEFVVTPPALSVTTFTGDDVAMMVNLTAPVTLYGTSTSTLQVSTNGWVSFSPLATFSDLSESSADFISGNMGGAGSPSAPGIACLWEDLDMGNGAAGQAVEVFEGPVGTVQISWTNGDYFPTTPFGTVSCTIDTAAQTVVFDYTNYLSGAAPMEGLVGVTDGGSVGGAVAVELDLAMGGTVTPYMPTNPTETVFQNFDTSGLFPETFDLGGLTMTFADSSGLGTWFVF